MFLHQTLADEPGVHCRGHRERAKILFLFSFVPTPVVFPPRAAERERGDFPGTKRESNKEILPGCP